MRRPLRVFQINANPQPVALGLWPMALNQHYFEIYLSNSKCFQTNIWRNHLEVNIEKSEYDWLVCKPVHDIHFLQY